MDSNVEEAKIAAHALGSGAEELTSNSLLATSTVKITEANSLNEQRAAFSDLSNALIVLVKESGVESGEIHISETRC